MVEINQDPDDFIYHHDQYKIIINNMLNQNKELNFCIESEVKIPLHHVSNQHLSQLQNKIVFFQGQIDPLISQTGSLKDQLINLYKLMIRSRQILRNLLPFHDDPAKKLKLQMAGIDEIALMIQQDWKRMQFLIQKNEEAIKILTTEKMIWCQRYIEQSKLRKHQFQLYQTNVAEMKRSHDEQMLLIKTQMQDILLEHKDIKRVMNQQFQMKLRVYDRTLLQYQHYKNKVYRQNQEYEKYITRLKGQIEASLVSFEQGKKNIKTLYQKLIQDKLNEQKEGFQILLQMKEDQKMELFKSIAETEDEFKRKMAQKEYEISRLTQNNANHAKQTNKLKEELWNKQLQLDKQFLSNQKRVEQINALNIEKEGLQASIKKKDEELVESIRSYEKILQDKRKQLDILRQQGGLALQNILKEKQKIENKLSEKQKKLRETMISLKKAQDQWKAKIQVLKQQWRAKQSKLIDKIQQKDKRELNLNDQLSKLKKQKQQLIISHQKETIALKSQHSSEMQQIIKGYTGQIQQIERTNYKILSQLKKQQEAELREFHIKSNEEMRQFTMNYNKRLHQIQMNRLGDLQKFDKKILQMRASHQQTQKRINDIISEGEKQRQKFNQQKAKLNEQKEQLNQQKQKQMQQFLLQLQQKQKQISNITQVFQLELKMLKEGKHIQRMKTLYQEQIDRIKEEFIARWNEQQQKTRQHIHILVKSNEQKIADVEKIFNENVQKIIEKTQLKNQSAHEEILQNLDENIDISSADLAQKKDFIIKKIENLKNINKYNQEIIQKMKEDLFVAQRNFEKRVNTRKEELEYQKYVFLKEYDKKMQQMVQKCKKKVQQIQGNRLKHTQIMYSQFNELKNQFQRQYSFLNKRYLQLELMFQERPSRPQDLSKIKQLINLQTKLDIQIKSYQKKMKTANEIVKYLHLQLQNYKDTYDIFSQNAQNPMGGLIGTSYKSHSTNQILQKIKINKEQQEHKIVSQEDKHNSLEQTPFRKLKITPLIKQLTKYNEDQSEHSQSQDQTERRNKHERRMSNLFNDRSQKQKRRRFKTEEKEKDKIENKQSEMLMNAQQFINLIKGNHEDPVLVPIKDDKYEKKRNYRKRKLFKKLNVVSKDHFF